MWAKIFKKGGGILMEVQNFITDLYNLIPTFKDMGVEF
jgi:hypothetical protein